MEKRALQGPVSFLSYFLIAALALAFSGLWAPPPTALANQDQSYDNAAELDRARSPRDRVDTRTASHPQRPRHTGAAHSPAGLGILLL